MAAHGLEIVGLSCARGDRPLFCGIDQTINAGELLHVVGSNGSGKTTLLRTLSGLSRPAEGEIRWHGVSVDQLGDDYRRDLAYLGHKDGVQSELTSPENLLTLACATETLGTDTVDRALERLGLAAYRSFPAKILSQGQKRRLALARLLLHAKPLWILDEPLTALDVDSCKLVVQMLAEHAARGGIAVISSHQAFEIPTATVRRVDLDAARSGNARSVTVAAAARSGISERYSA